MLKTTVKIKKVLDKTNNILQSLEKLKHKDVLVGVPQSENQRKDEQNGDKIGNAALLYIQEKGDPLVKNAPPRPVLDPSIQENREEIAELFSEAIQEALKGNSNGVDTKLKRVAIFIETKVKERFGSDKLAPLSPVTIRQKARKIKNKVKYMQFINSNGNPLINTGELRNAIKGVVRDK